MKEVGKEAPMKGWFSEDFFVSNGITTAIFLIGLLFFRWMANRVIRGVNKGWTAQQRLRSIGYIRTAFFAALAMGLLYIWGEQVHHFAVSLFAIAFAVVFSVKEVFMCMNGSLLRFRGNMYNLGDRIEIAGVKGDVIDLNLFSTTLLETGPGSKNNHHSGRVVVFPNSLVLTNFVVNESFIEHVYFHNLMIPLRLEENWKRGKDLLLEIAKEECAPHLEMAKKRMSETSEQMRYLFPSVEPRVVIQMPEPGKVNLILRFPTPVHIKGRLEQTILNRFLDKFFTKE